MFPLGENTAKPTMLDFPKLEDIADLRNRSNSLLKRVARTLQWFSRTFRDGAGPPRDFWTRRNRPGPPRSRSLPYAFDIWHGMVHAERALRDIDRQSAKALGEELRELTHAVVEKINGVSRDRPLGMAALLLADDIFGTFSMTAASSVLRAEVVPRRFAHTPSYIAGYVLFAELAQAANRAKAHAGSALTERAPRLALAAEAIDAVLTFADHLDRRAQVFTDIAATLRHVRRMNQNAENLSKALSTEPIPATSSENVSHALNVAEEVYLAKLLIHLRQAEYLVVSTRELFKKWVTTIEELRRMKSQPIQNLAGILTDGIMSTSDETSTNLRSQEAIQRSATEFATTIHEIIAQITDSCGKVLRTPDTNLPDKIEELERHLQRLRGYHCKWGDGPRDQQPPESPSVRDCSRFRFLTQLCNEYGRPDDRLSRFARHYVGFDDPLSVGIAEPGKEDKVMIIKRLGKSPAGQSVCDWWTELAKAYGKSGEERKDGKEEKEGPQEWISLRDKSRFVLEEFVKTIKEAHTSQKPQDQLEAIAAAFKQAAKGFGACSQRIRQYLEKSATWCSHHAKEVLLERSQGGEESVDPVEIAAGLFLAARMGRAWSAALEDAALRCLCESQRRDGGFNAYAPLTKHHGCVYFAPSVQTVGLVFRFLELTTKRFTDAEEAARLARWEDFILVTGKYLVGSAVGLSSKHDGDRELTGWHSDRHPEPERIDCRVTSLAVEALTDLDLLLDRLANRRALAGLDTEFPILGLEALTPTDCERHERKEPFALFAVKIVDWIRHHKEPELYLHPNPPRADPGAHTCMLLYGPPGTGKTTSLYRIAGELGWPTVTIGPGAFLAEGRDREGQMALQMFRRLKFVSRCIIVFDEFDVMVPGREKYGEKHLTAAMLPLLSSLRQQAESHECLIVFTTNYVGWMDAAARRSGRIDTSRCICYPDITSRLLYWIENHSDDASLINTKQLEKFLEASVWQPLPVMKELIENPDLVTHRVVRPEDYYRDTERSRILDDELARMEVRQLLACRGDAGSEQFLRDEDLEGFRKLFRDFGLLKGDSLQNTFVASSLARALEVPKDLDPA